MRIAVIGAGPAGLAFADRLQSIKPDAVIDIFEKSKHIGGISKTVVYKGNRIDIGGHRFFSKSDEVMQWWTNKFPIDLKQSGDDNLVSYRNSIRSLDGFNVVSPLDKNTDRVLLIRRRKSRILFSRRMYDYPLKLNSRTIKNIGFKKLVLVSISYLHSKLTFNKPRNLEEFIISRFGRRLYQMFFESYTEKVWGRHPSDISAEWGIQRIKGLSIRKLLLDNISKVTDSFFPKPGKNLSQKHKETSLIEKFLYPKFGPGQMWEEVAKDLQEKGALIHLESEIIKLNFNNINNNRLDSITIRNSNGEIESKSYDFVISTMPIKELVLNSKDINGKNPFKNELTAIAKGLPYRDFITVGLLLDSLAGPQGEALDDTWIYIQEPDVKVGRIQIFNNWSPYLVNDPNKYWIGLEYFCNEGDDLWQLTDNQLIELAKEEIEKLSLSSKSKIIDGTVLREKKTYPAYFDSYDEFGKLIEHFNTIENLILIGRNGMHKYNNQDHSMLSGFRAAELIAADDISPSTKSQLWLINAEQEYHEEKA